MVESVNNGVGMIGLGKLGKPVLEFFGKEQDRKCYGYDVEDENRSSPYYTKLDSIKQIYDVCSLIFIAVPTPHHFFYSGTNPTTNLQPKDFDYEEVKDVLLELCGYDLSEKTVVLISTTLPGTCREQFYEMVPDLIYNPYFIAMGTVYEDMNKPEMILIGMNPDYPESYKPLLDFYKTMYCEEKENFVICEHDTAEAIKVFYNTYISTKIAFVNMIQDFGLKDSMIDAPFICDILSKCNQRLMSSQYMKPGLGDAGCCHPRDNIALSFLAKKHGMNYDFFGNLMGIREKQAENTANKLIDMMIGHGCNNIVINGVGYKEGLPLKDGSYSLLVGYYLEEQNVNPIYVDKVIYPDNQLNQGEKYLVFMAHPNIEHAEFPKDSVMVNPWDGYSYKYKEI